MDQIDGEYVKSAVNGVAMKQGSGTLIYLNGDHLSSTVLATTNTGAFQERQGYYGYGKYRTGGVLPTDNRYTGQKLDATTGLMYYGARYYDRMVGMFVSPDSLVPDPTNVWDYNRYGYAKLNPLKYNDPTGHCATLEDGAPDFDGDTACWQTAYAIYGHGAAGSAGFAEDWRVSADDWLENIAKAQYATTEYLQPFLEEYNAQFCAQAGLNCGGYVANTPGEYPALVNPIFDPIVNAATAACSFWDCPGLALDTASLLTSIAQSTTSACSVATGPVCGSAAAYFTFLDVSLTSASTLYTVGQYPSGGSSEADLAVSGTDVYIMVRTLTSPASSVPFVGIGYDLAVLGWGVIKPFVDQPSIVR